MKGNRPAGLEYLITPASATQSGQSNLLANKPLTPGGIRGQRSEVRGQGQRTEGRQQPDRRGQLGLIPPRGVAMCPTLSCFLTSVLCPLTSVLGGGTVFRVLLFAGFAVASLLLA